MGYKKAEFRIVKTAGQCTATPETNNTTGDDLLLFLISGKEALNKTKGGK